jgi:hypothetical protein
VSTVIPSRGDPLNDFCLSFVDVRSSQGPLPLVIAPIVILVRTLAFY